MPLFRRRRFLLLAIALPLIGQAATPDPLDYVRQLPDTNPYVPTLTHYVSLPPDEKYALTIWVSPAPDTKPVQLSDDQLTIARSLTASLVAASRPPPPAGNIWPIRPNPDDPDNPAANIIPEVGHLRELARIAIKVADDAPASDSIEIYTATAQLARSQRLAHTLIHHLTGVAIEGMAVQAAARRLLDYSPAELARLAADWPDVKTIPSEDGALDAERNVFFIPIIENIILPGVKARLDADSNEAGSPTTGPNETRPNSASGAGLKRFESFLDSTSLSDAGIPDPNIDTWLARIRAHPLGPDGYFTDLIARYDEITRAQLGSARQALAAKPTIRKPEDDFILGMLTPSFDNFARALHSGDTGVRMLLSAIHHRLGQLGQSIDPFAAFDPWAETPMTPFAKEVTSDGGFILRSRYERRPGEPVTYKFAAPDAGLVRQN